MSASPTLLPPPIHLAEGMDGWVDGWMDKWMHGLMKLITVWSMDELGGLLGRWITQRIS